MRNVLAAALRCRMCPTDGTLAQPLPQDSMVSVHVLVPYSQGELVDEIHRTGVVASADFGGSGVELRAHVPLSLAQRLQPLRAQTAAAAEAAANGAAVGADEDEESFSDDGWSEEELALLEEEEAAAAAAQAAAAGAAAGER